MQTAMRAGFSHPCTQVQGAGPEAGVGGSPAAPCTADLAGGCMLQTPESVCPVAFRGVKEGKERASPLTPVLSPHPVCPNHCDLLRKSKYQRTELAASPASPQASGPLNGLSSAGKTMLKDLHGSSGSWAASLCSCDCLRWPTLTTVFETHTPSPLYHPLFCKVTSHIAGWLHFCLSSLESKFHESMDFACFVRTHILSKGFANGISGEEPTCQCRRHKRCGFHPWVGKIPWRRK